MSLIGTVSSPMDARYSPRDTPDPAAPSVSETGPFIGSFTDAQHPGQSARSQHDPARHTSHSGSTPPTHQGHAESNRADTNRTRPRRNHNYHGRVPECQSPNVKIGSLKREDHQVGRQGVEP